MNSLSHDVFLPDETVSLGPLAICVQEPRQGYNFSKSAVRALDILELFARVDRPLRAIDVTRLLGISPSSTIQLLKTMMDCALSDLRSGDEVLLSFTAAGGIRWLAVREVFR